MQVQLQVHCTITSTVNCT